MSPPLVTIIIRTRNRPKYLLEALRSVALQDYRPLEVVIVDSGSQPVRSLVEQEQLPLTVKIVELAESSGRSHAANVGIENATGQFIGFLDDDDIFYPFHVSRLAGELMRGEKFVYGDALRADQVIDSTCATGYRTVAFSLPISLEEHSKSLWETNYIPILAALFDRECLTQGVAFDQNLEVLEDWDLWLQISSRYQIGHVAEITAEYRMRNDATNTVGQNLELWDRSRKYVQQKHQMLRSANSGE